MVHIIAEGGTNHNGSFETACKLIDTALSCEADSIKFQLIYPEGLYVPMLLEDGEFKPWEVLEIRRKGMLSDEEYRKLYDYAKGKNLPLSMSVFDQRGLDLLEEFNPPYVKIASTDLNHHDLLRRSVAKGKRIILSTGMSSLQDIEKAVKVVQKEGNVEVVLMHCVSIYPCSTQLTNLGFIDTLKETFGLPLGFSDHTESSVAASIAVSKGVEWVEKHFTLDRAAKGFDHAYAAEPDTLKRYVQALRAAESACQATDNKISESEASIRDRARRGLYAAREIKEGETFTEDMILAVRPPAPFGPDQVGEVVGKSSNRTIRQYEPLSEELLK